MFLDLIVETKQIIEPVINENKPMIIPIIAVVVVGIVIAILSKMVIKRELTNAKKV